jgi:hypothetical protein
MQKGMRPTFNWRLRLLPGRRTQPFQGWHHRAVDTQGSSFLATLGFGTEPRWGSPDFFGWVDPG